MISGLSEADQASAIDLHDQMAALREDGIAEEDEEEYGDLRRQLGELLSQLRGDDEERPPRGDRPSLGDRLSRGDHENMTSEEREVSKKELTILSSLFLNE